MMGLWYRQKLHGTREASNDGRVRVRIIHGLTLVIKNSYTYYKSLLALEELPMHAPRGRVGRS